MIIGRGADWPPKRVGLGLPLKCRCTQALLVGHVTGSQYSFITRTWLRYVRVFAVANPSVVCLSSVTFVRPTQGVETFGNISSPFCTLAIFWLPCKILRRSSHGNPSVVGVKRKSGSKIEPCHVRVSHLLMSFLYTLRYLRIHFVCTLAWHA